MKTKFSLRLISMIAAATMLLPLMSCKDSEDTDTTSGTEAPPIESFSALDISHTKGDTGYGDDTPVDLIFKADSDDGVFELTGDAKASGTSVTFPASKLSGLSMTSQFGTKQAATYEMTLTAPYFSGTNTLFIGMRLDATDADAYGKDGLWIAIGGGKVGVRYGSWPAVSQSGIEGDIDFKSARKLYITDDPETNTITLQTEGADGAKTEIARFAITDKNVKFYLAGSDEPKRTQDLTFPLPKCGYFSLWAYYPKADVVVSDFKSNGIIGVAGDLPEANMLASRDVFSDTWVNTDDEGRLTIQSNKGPTDRKVGIFYFLWHDGPYSNELVDNTKAYMTGGIPALQEAIKNGNTAEHYWAEPYLGYYCSDDEWIIRKHANQLVAAGVDFVYFDVTNGLIYESVLETVLRVWSEMRIEGQATPQICFLLNPSTSHAQKSFNALYDMLFESDRYDDLYFKWDGKLLLLAPESIENSLSKEVREKFTFRRSWVYARNDNAWYMQVRGKGCWPWAAMYPQGVGKDFEGNTEQMVVMCGFWANGSYGTNAGRSYANGKVPSNVSEDYSFKVTTSGQGLAFQEHFDRAIETNPEVVMITGWNEWWAQRQTLGAGTGQTIAGSYTVTEGDPIHQYYYVDTFSPEYSRDIEPVKGLFNDNYYYQMTQNIRAYKGTRSLQTAFGQKTIDLSDSMSQWFSVGPEYRDQVGDTAHRDNMSFVGQIHYKNDTGRNDFINIKVSLDNDNAYFMAECEENITAPEGTNWMNLFIDADANASTGWSGYDYIINRSQNGGKCSVEKFVDGKWEFVSAGEAEYKVDGKYITIKVARSMINVADTFDFKWADNSVSDGDAMQFIDLGDAAPSERFNYRYTTAAQAEKKPSMLTDSMIVLKAGSYNAYVGGQSVMLDESNTYAVMMGEEDKIYLPKAFCADKLGLDVSSCEVLSHYGVEYVDAYAAINAMGKTVSQSENLIVIADNAVSENDMLTLYRSLY